MSLASRGILPHELHASGPVASGPGLPARDINQPAAISLITRRTSGLPHDRETSREFLFPLVESMSLAAQSATTNSESLAEKIAGGTINKVMAKSNLELGIM